MFFVGVVLGYAGIEMAGFHAKETRNPKRDFPRAIFLAAVLIVGISILATLAIAFVVPQAKLSLVAGIPQAFAYFFKSLGIGVWATKLMAGLVAIGTLALISTWLMGPSKGLYASERTGDLPPELHYVNKRHVPVAVLRPPGHSQHHVRPDVPARAEHQQQLLDAYRVDHADPRDDVHPDLRGGDPAALHPAGHRRAYKIPGGKVGIWLVAGVGIFGSAFSLIIGFVPPSGVSHFADADLHRGDARADRDLLGAAVHHRADQEAGLEDRAPRHRPA